MAQSSVHRALHPLTTITLSPDSPSKSRNLEQMVSYPSLGRVAVGPPPSPPPPPRCRTGLLPSGKYQTSAKTAGCCEWTPPLPMPPSSPSPWLYSSLSSQVTPNNKLLWWAWLLQLSRHVILNHCLCLWSPIASFPGLLIWERSYTCPAQCLILRVRCEWYIFWSWSKKAGAGNHVTFSNHDNLHNYYKCKISLTCKIHSKMCADTM